MCSVSCTNLYTIIHVYGTVAANLVVIWFIFTILLNLTCHCPEILHVFQALVISHRVTALNKVYCPWLVMCGVLKAYIISNFWCALYYWKWCHNLSSKFWYKKLYFYFWQYLFLCTNLLELFLFSDTKIWQFKWWNWKVCNYLLLKFGFAPVNLVENGIF